jgi:tRNA A-37 threonylcarbamoyl transferase component Bud32
VNPQAVERERQLLACLDEVMDAPASERAALVRSRLGDDPSLVRELERLLIAAEQPDEKYLAESVDGVLQPVLKDLADHSDTAGDVPTALVAALEPRYTIQERIGRGGMASVYLAFDNTLGRHVAVKSLRPELADSISLERFQREITIAATIDHPCVVPVYDRGSADGLLYYIMPYVAGGSLRDLLLERPQLEIRRAIDIARNVAEAVDAAHARKIVHRDIKPANILLDDHRAYVADFGVARLVDAAGREQLTRTGVALGTALYMSPEQVSSPTKVDGRCDIYALGCVLYEMLGGEAPFTGPTQREIMAKHLAAAIPDLTVVRPTVTPAMQQVIAKALQKAPADRFATAGEFIDAFERNYNAPAKAPANRFDDLWEFANPLGVDSRTLPWQRRLLKVSRAGLVAIIVATGVLALIRWSPIAAARRAAAAPVDTTQYAILPFEYQAGTQASLNEGKRLHDAFARWSGITLSDPVRVRDLIEGQVSRLTATQAMSLARRLGAGRYVRAEVAGLGPDSVRIEGRLYNTVDGAVLADHAIRVRRDSPANDSVFASLADRMLLRATSESDAHSSTTQSLPSRQAFLRGQRALNGWHLTSADSAFSAAATFDDGSAHAHLWTALVRAWRGLEPARWRLPAEQAVLGQAMLSERDRGMAAAIAAQSRDDMGQACPLWQSVTRPNPRDFVVWYGFAHCQANDSAVIADARSPSQWRFRTSYQNALVAYRRSFQLNPGALAAFRQNSFASLRRLFKISGSSIRTGAPAFPDSGGFVAYPSWAGDSVAYVPYPQGRMRAYRISAADQEAVRRLRLQFRDVATFWVSSAPSNPAALEALAISLSMLGDISGLDTLRRARTLSKNAEDQYRIGVQEVLMGLSFAVPHGIGRLVSVRSLADSLLNDSMTALNPSLGALLAALTGRAGQAASLASSERATRRLPIDVPLRSGASALLLYAALGGPIDTLARLVKDVESGIESSPTLALRDNARRAFLARSATFAFSVYRFEVLASLKGLNPLLDLQIAWASGDTAGARRGLQAIGEQRVNSLPWTLSIDALCPEAELLAEMGDLKRAADWIGPTLDALPQLAPQIEFPERIATLVRAMALRARIAEQLGRSEEARPWAAAVVALWSGADPFLQPQVQNLRRLAR